MLDLDHWDNLINLNLSLQQSQRIKVLCLPGTVPGSRHGSRPIPIGRFEGKLKTFCDSMIDWILNCDLLYRCAVMTTSPCCASWRPTFLANLPTSAATIAKSSTSTCPALTARNCTSWLSSACTVHSSSSTRTSPSSIYWVLLFTFQFSIAIFIILFYF